MTAATAWSSALAEWGIPPAILAQAPQSPWIHPVQMFTVPERIPSTPAHERAREAMHSGAMLLDVGCGGGIAAFAAAGAGDVVIGVDHQQEMLNVFAAEADSRGLRHQEILGDWPAVADQTPVADVVTCHHVVYNVSEIVPFLSALDAHAAHRVVIEMPQEHPLASMSNAWRHFWAIERPAGPGPTDLVDVLTSMGITATVELWDHGSVRQLTMEEQVQFTRVRLCLSAERDDDIKEYLAAHPAPRTRALATLWWDVS